MGLIFNHASGSANLKMGGGSATGVFNALAFSGSACFQPGHNAAAGDIGSEQSFTTLVAKHPDAAYVFSGSVGGKNKTVFLGDVVISGSLTKSGGGAVDGTGAASRVAYWTDTDTISYSNNLTWNNSDLGLGSGIGLTFATDEKIESDGTDLSITVGAGGDINIPADIGLTFGDDGEKIEGDGTNLSIASSGELDLTADGLIDVNGSANLDVDIAGTIAIDGTSTVSIQGAGATDLTTSSGAVTIDGAGGVSIAGNAAEVDITTTGALDVNVGSVDLDSTAGIAMDGTTVSIDGTDDSNLTVTGAGKHLSVLLAGGGDQNLTISSAGTAADALDINASAGGIDIDAAAAVDILAASTLSAKGATGASFGDDTGTWEFDGSGAVTETGMASIVVNPSGVLTMQGGGVSTFGDDTGTIAFGGTGAVTTSGITTVALASSSTFDIDAEGALTLDGSAITIGGDSDVAVVLESSTLDVNSSGAITIDGTSTVSIDGADDMNFTITSSGASEDLTIQQIGANDSSILITAAGTGADAVSIDATAGSMVIAPSLIDGKTLTVGNTSSTYLKLTPHGTPASERVDLYNATGTADDAIKILADAGGVSIVAADDSLFLDANGTAAAVG